MDIKTALRSKIVSSWLNKRYLSENAIISLKTEFMKNKPFKHLFVKDFLSDKMAQDVLFALSKESFSNKKSDLFKFMQTYDLIGSNRKILSEFRKFLCSNEFISIMSFITGRNPKSGFLDMHGTLYQDTDYLLCHDDKLLGRNIAYIFYLSTLSKKDGGALRLYNSKAGKPVKISKELSPKANSFAFFEVLPTSFHEVEEVRGDAKRITINGWFHGN